jgi:hypothetical protein
VAVRAKFRVQEVNLRPSYDTSKPEPWANIVLGAVGDDGIPEHQRYHEATPSGTINITVNNRAAIPFFEVGALLYVDFTSAEKAEA